MTQLTTRAGLIWLSQCTRFGDKRISAILPNTKICRAILLEQLADMTLDTWERMT
jgi:hypothetical protein